MTSFFALSEIVVETYEMKKKDYGIGLELVENWIFLSIFDQFQVVFRLMPSFG
jgi:hypothetical protein